MSRAIPAYLPIAAGFVFVASWMLAPAPRASVAAAGIGAESSGPAFPEARGGKAPLPEGWGAEKPEDTSPGALPSEIAAAKPPSSSAASASLRAAAAREASVWYSGCREARDAGAAPIYRGQPGYRTGMDGDNDGIACEDYRPR